MFQMLRVLIFAVLLGGGYWPAAQAEEGWLEEFERICSRTGEAGDMSEAELSQLITDSERLREKIAASNDPASKVYLFRLVKCRDFFVFMKDAAVSAQRP